MIVKAGDKLRCMDNKGCEWWRVGNVYEVLEDRYGLYIYINKTYGWYLEGNTLGEYLSERFKLEEA